MARTRKGQSFGEYTEAMARLFRVLGDKKFESEKVNWENCGFESKIQLSEAIKIGLQKSYIKYSGNPDSYYFYGIYVTQCFAEAALSFCPDDLEGIYPNKHARTAGSIRSLMCRWQAYQKRKMSRLFDVVGYDWFDPKDQDLSELEFDNIDQLYKQLSDGKRVGYTSLKRGKWKFTNNVGHWYIEDHNAKACESEKGDIQDKQNEQPPADTGSESGETNSEGSTQGGSRMDPAKIPELFEKKKGIEENISSQRRELEAVNRELQPVKDQILEMALVLENITQGDEDCVDYILQHLRELVV